MSYNTKNYTEQGGEVTHIGGTVIIEQGGNVQGLGGAAVPAATTEARGTVKQAAAVADATADTQLAQLNALLAALRTAGIVAAE